MSEFTGATFGVRARIPNNRCTRRAVIVGGAGFYVLAAGLLMMRARRPFSSAPLFAICRFAVALIATMVVALAAAHAQVVETFDYPTGALSGRKGGSGWSGEWRNQSSRNGGDWTIGKKSLDHPALPRQSGFAALSPGDGSRCHRNLAQRYDSGLAYLSFLSRNTKSTADPYSALELLLMGDGEAFRVFQIGLLRNDDGNPNGSAESAFYARSRARVGGEGGDTAFLTKFNTKVNLFVVRFNLDADTASVFVNPDETTDLTVSGDGDLTLFPGFSFDRVCIANFVDDNEFVIDEIRIADTPPKLIYGPSGER
jgi:hypothetical protein